MVPPMRSPFSGNWLIPLTIKAARFRSLMIRMVSTEYKWRHHQRSTLDVITKCAITCGRTKSLLWGAPAAWTYPSLHTCIQFDHIMSWMKVLKQWARCAHREKVWSAGRRLKEVGHNTARGVEVVISGSDRKACKQKRTFRTEIFLDLCSNLVYSIVNTVCYCCICNKASTTIRVSWVITGHVRGSILL